MSKSTVLTRLHLILAVAGFLAWAVPVTADEAGALQEDAEVLLGEAVAAAKAYVYASPPATDSFEVFDAEKGDKVVLKFVRVVTDGCWEKLADETWVLCAEATAAEGDDYVVWMLMSRQPKTEPRSDRGGAATSKAGTLRALVVREAEVKSVNGEARSKIEEASDGTKKVVSIE